MPARRGKVQRVRHNSRKWVLKALESAEATGGMLTKDLQRRVASLSGAKIPAYSVYQALRTLVRRRVISATRRGRQFSYRLLAGRGSDVPSRKAPSDSPAPTSLMVREPALPAPAPLPHKLAPGEVTILSIEEFHVETATNEHGKLVLQRHPRPK